MIFALVIYLGGLGAVYRSERKTGTSGMISAIEAILWPMAVGRYLATHCYEPSTLTPRPEELATREGK